MSLIKAGDMEIVSTPWCHNGLSLLEAVTSRLLRHGPLTRYAKLRVAHAPGMPGTFFPPQPVSDPDMHYGTCVTHGTWFKPGSLTSGFLWSRWRVKRYRHSRRMRNPQFCVSGKSPMLLQFILWLTHFADDIFRCIFGEKNSEFWLKFQ